MKIVFIISSLSSGGAERVLSLLANYLSKNHEVIILTFSTEEPFYELSSDISHIKLDLLKKSNTKLESIKNTINRLLVLKKILKKINSDINVSFMTHTNILACIASKLNHQKIIISERIVYNFYTSNLLERIRKIIYPKADYLVTQTYADKKSYSFMKNVEVIYNLLKINIVRAKREKIVLAVGRLDKQKGFDRLINAFSNITNKEWKLCIAGEGLEKENLLDMIKEKNLNNVYLIGNQKNIFEWYAKASIFVLSSEKEGFPNVLLEAMGSGCACISFDCPNGPNEIIKNEINGILVKNQHTDNLAFQIQRLIDNEALRLGLSSEAVLIKDKYSVNIISGQWEKLMKKVIND